jgi:cytoskeleton-associated protein 5
MDKQGLQKLCDKVVIAMGDGTSSVRDASANCLVAMIRAHTEAKMAPFLQGLEKPKLEKAIAASKSESSSKVKKTAAESSSSTFPAKIVSAPPEKTNSKPVISVKNTKPKKPSANVSGNVTPLSAIQFEYTDSEAEQEVFSQISGDVLESLSNANWKTRLEGVQKFSDALNQLSLSKAEPFIRVLLIRVGWKEKNFQVTNAMIACFLKLIDVEKGFNRACTLLLAPGLVEKLADSKVKKNASDCLDACVASCSVAFLFSELYSIVNDIKNPKTLSDVVLWQTRIVEKFGCTGLVVNDFSKYVKQLLENSNQLVRTNAVLLVCTIKAAGLNIRGHLNGLGSGILGVLDTELTKTGNMSIKPQNSTLQVEAGSKSSASVEYDVCSSIGNSLLVRMEDTNWKERKAALEEFMDIISTCNTPVSPNLSSELVNSLKTRLTDNNKNLALFSVSICGKLAKVIGKPFDRYLKTFLPSILSHLSDLKQVVRTTVISTITQISNVVGLDVCLPDILGVLNMNQPQSRKEILNWLVEHKNDIVNVDTLLEMLYPVLACLLDKNLDVRKYASQLLAFIAAEVGVTICRKKASESYKGAQLATIIQFLDTLPEDQSPKKAVVHSQKPNLEEFGEISKKPKNMKSSSSGLVTKKEFSEKIGGSLLALDLKLKDSRVSSDKGFLKWAFDSPRREFCELLSEQCRASFSSDLHGLLFSTDHYKEKDYLEGLKQLEDFLKSEEEGKNIAAVANCDIILKYITIRFFDSNTSILKKCIDVLECLFSVLDDVSYSLSDYEAQIFLQFFINKLGDPKETMRIRLRAISKKLGRIYPVSKLLLYFMKGLESKNTRTRIECLDEISWIISRNGSSVFVPAKTVPTIAMYVCDRDATTRNSALSCINEIYLVLGADAFNRYIAKVGDKEKDVINDRLKKVIGNNQPLDTKDKTFGENAGSLVKSSINEETTAKKHFSLELDKLEIFTKPAEKLPFSRSTESSTVNRFSSMDEQINTAILHLASFDSERALDAVRVLEKILSTTPVNSVIREKDLVGIITPLLGATFEQLSDSEQIKSRLCRHFVSVLVHIFSSPESATLVPYPSLEECIRKILFGLVEPRLQSIDSSKNLSRALNMLMVRLIDCCAPNYTFRALLRILKESAIKDMVNNLSEDQVQKKYIELGMKCLWKVTKLIPVYIRDNRLSVDDVLLDIDEFLNDAPPAYWKRRIQQTGDPHIDMPLRTVKTILHEIVNVLGEVVISHAQILKNHESNYTLAYLRQMLVSFDRKQQQVAKEKVSEPSLEVLLDQIFAQIANKDQTKIGIQRLHELRIADPSIEPIVQKKIDSTGFYFQGYIRRGLTNLEQEGLIEQPAAQGTVGGMATSLDGIQI